MHKVTIIDLANKGKNVQQRKRQKIKYLMGCKYKLNKGANA